MIPRVSREPLIPPSPAGTVASSTSASRRRSVGGERRRQSFVPPPNSVPAVKTDPRPITDKNYQNQSAKQLLQYLTKSGYDYPISLKSLSRPSGKDFSNIVSFLLRKLDPSFQNGTMKFEDEVAMNFKAMGYPYPISKTALVAAGSPHTWPALLAALTWLMEHLKCMEADLSASQGKDETTTQFESMDDLDKKSEKMFFTFLSSAYRAFLQGDEATKEQLEDGLVEAFNGDNGVIESEIERISELNAAIDDKANHLSQHSQSLPAMEKKREDYATDLEQFHDLVNKMEEHKSALDQKVKERTAELEDTNQKIEAIAEQISSLKDTVKNQELSVEDVQKMQDEQARVKEALERATTTRQQHKDALWQADVQLKTLFEDLDAVVDDYNAKLAELTLALPDAAQISNFKINVKTESASSADQSLLLNTDLFAEVRPFFSQTKSDNIEETTRCRRALQEDLSELESSEEAFTEALDKLKIVADKKTRCEETLNREKEQHEATLAVRLREVAAIEEKVSSLRDPAALEEQIARYQRQCTQLEALRMKHEEENIANKKAVQEEIGAALKAAEEHNEHVRKKFAELQQYVLRKKASLGKLTVPADLGAGN